MPLVLNGTTGVQDNSGAFVQGTSVASTSGTSIDFTSIPSWVKRVTVVFNGVSTNGSSFIQAQIGSGSVTTSGYSSAAWNNSVGVNTATSGFVYSFANATNAITGTMNIVNLTGNTWVATSVMFAVNNSAAASSSGVVTISGALDRVRITTVNGTDAFDAGTINILYE